MQSGNKLRRGRSAGHTDHVAAAPPPEAASDPTSTASPDPAITPGVSVSTTTDGSWSEVTAGSPHSRRATTDQHIIIDADNNNNIISNTDADPTQQWGGIDLSLHPDLSDANSEGGKPPATTNTTNIDVQPGGEHTDPSPFAAIFEKLDLLRSQSAIIQAQLDGQREVSEGFARSITNIGHELQTLRDTSKAQFDMIGHATTIADESHARMLEFKTTASHLTYQFHTLSTKVNNFIAQQAQPTPPPAPSSTIEDAFAAVDAALSDGLASMQNKVSDRLDREISSRNTNPTTTGVHFANVEDCWSHREPYDSDAAYAAAHTPPAARTDPSPTSPSTTTDDTTTREFSTRAQDCCSNCDHRHHSPRGSYGDSLSPRYNGPSSPRYRLAITRGLSDDILAWHAGAISGGDAVDGIDFLEDPDVEALGITSDLACGVAEDHMDIVTNWVNPRWMQRDSRDFHAQENGYTAPSTGGPNITDILRQISNWDKLSDLSPTGLHAFYNQLRRHSFKWKIALMPFGALNLSINALDTDCAHAD